MTAGLISHAAKKVDFQQLIDIAGFQRSAGLLSLFSHFCRETTKVPASLVDVRFKNKIYNIIKYLAFRSNLR